MKIYKTQEILNKLESAVKYKKSFNLIRFGDGGIKFIHAILFKKLRQLDIICKKEGLPKSKILEILELWGYYARQADFIDTPEVYYNGSFWPRVKNPNKHIKVETEKKMLEWRDLYSRAEFDNENYCNPEVNCLMVLDIPGRRNLFDLKCIKKVCVLTANPNVKKALKDHYNVDIVEIVGQYENHYVKSFSKTTKIIKERAKDYDCWFIAAGELGRIYSGLIKECGGRSLDLGFLIDYWVDGNFHPRLHKFINASLTNPLEFKLTIYGKLYIDNI